MNVLIWKNGEPLAQDLISAEQDNFSGLDRTATFGDGVFETMLLRVELLAGNSSVGNNSPENNSPEDGSPEDNSPGEATESLSNRSAIHLFDRHMHRLQGGLSALSLDCSIEQVRSDLLAILRSISTSPAIATESIETFALKYVVSRGDSTLGYGCTGSEPRRVALLSPLQAQRLKSDCTLGVCSVRLSSQPILAAIKHCNRLEQVLAKQEMDAQGLDEGLMLDGQSQVVEAIAANIFIQSGNCLRTPPISDAGVAGVMREHIIQEVAPALSIPVEVVSLTLEDIVSADALMLTNAIQGVRIVERCENTTWPYSAMLTALQQRVAQDMQLPVSG